MRLSSVCTIEYSRFWIFYECSKFFFKGMDSKANKNQAFVMYWSCIKRMVQTKHLYWSHTTIVSFCFFFLLYFFLTQESGASEGHTGVYFFKLHIIVSALSVSNRFSFQKLLFPTFVGNTRHRYENKPLFSTTKYPFKNFYNPLKGNI